MSVRRSHKARVLRKLPDAHCVRLNSKIDGKGFIVWPGKIQPRGLEQPAIGLGRTASEAWKSVKFEVGKEGER